MCAKYRSFDPQTGDRERHKKYFFFGGGGEGISFQYFTIFFILSDHFN